MDGRVICEQNFKVIDINRFAVGCVFVIKGSVESLVMRLEGDYNWDCAEGSFYLLAVVGFNTTCLCG